MASYFDAQPPSKVATAAELADIPDDDGVAKMGLLSPQVTRILDDLNLEEKSDSDSDGQASLSGDSSPSDKDAKGDRKSRLDKSNKHQSTNTIRKAQTSPLPRGNKQIKIAAPPERPGVGGQKHPHLARFHSLRSMLFNSQIEDKMAQCKEQQVQEESEAKWRQEHDSRRGLNRPKTPEKEKEKEHKPGFVSKMGNKLRRMTSKEVPTMEKIKEDGDNESTASSDEEERGRPRTRGSDDEINHSDIEDLVRWVSRRDPPSDGEARKRGEANEQAKEDSGHESLGHSDVEDLVRWVSRRDAPNKVPQSGLKTDEPSTKEEVIHTGYSDASTQSDSDVAIDRKETMNEDDVDDLVRWISRKDGPKAGPVREDRKATGNQSSSDSNDEDVAELVRWVTRKDDTSGESDVASEKGLPSIDENAPAQTSNARRGSTLKTEIPQNQPAADSRASLTHDDVDDLVRWVSKKQPEAKSVEGENPKATESRGSLTHNDVDDLVGWVSRKKPLEEKMGNISEDATNAAESNVSLPHDQPATDSRASLTHDDVDDLVRWVSKSNPDEKQVEENDDGILEWKREEDLKNAEAKT